MTFPTPDLPPPVAALLDRAIARLRLAAPDPAQWPQAISSTGKLTAPPGVGVTAEAVVECYWQEHMAAKSFDW